MFEKEAEEYAGNREVCDILDAISEDLQNYDYGIVAHYNIDPLVEECFKDGAEFGYNKGNKWHYVKDELPELYKDVLVVFPRGDCDVKRLTNHNEWVGRGSWCSLTDIIAWKEIVLPKEIKEND